MARQSRIDVPGYPQHLVVRGNNRGVLFEGDSDRHVFLHILEEALRRSATDLHAFVLMSNHVHLLATGHREGELSTFMHRLGSKYARLANQRWGRSGSLFEGRFRSSLVESDAYFVACMRYIDLNPVRAGLVRNPGDYPWSSFRRNAGMAPLAPLVPGESYLALGQMPEDRGKRYLELCEAGIPEHQLHCIRESARKCRALGDPSFVKEIERRSSRAQALHPPGRPGKSSLIGDR